METAATGIIRTLKQHGFLAYLVGGCVRDTLLGITPKDYDVATNALPDQVTELFPGSNLVGAAFGVVIAKVGDEQIEVATFRKDHSYEDGRRPTGVSFQSTPEEDVARRDFTINAMMMDPETGDVIDLVGGGVDLDSGIIRCVGDASERFAEDKLRMLRAVRFATTLSFSIDAGTLNAIFNQSASITDVAAERVQTELTKILTSGNAVLGIYHLRASGLLAELLPEIEALVGVKQPLEYHPEGDVFVHTLRVISDLPKGCSITLALAALLHDIGKPATFTNTDRIRFNGHEDVGAEMAASLLRRLKYSNDIIDTVVSHVSQHMKFRSCLKDMRRAKLKRFVSQDNFAELLELHRLDSMGSRGDLSAYNFVTEFLSENPPHDLKPIRLVNGHDLIEAGMKPGPTMGTTLEYVFDLQLEGKVTTKDEALSAALGVAL